MWKRVSLAIVVVIIAFLSRNVVELVLTGANFLCKRHCSARFVSGVVPVDEFAIPLLQFLPLRIVHEERAVSAYLFGLFPIASAHYHGPWTGCVLRRPQAFECDLGAPNLIREDELNLQPNAAIERLIDEEFSSVLPNGQNRNVRAIVIMHKGRFIAERYRSPFNKTTRQAGWSMTKSLLNTLIGKRGMNLDEYVTFPNGTRSNAIKIGHLLNMTSGLRWDEDYYPGGDPTHMLFMTNNTPHFAADRTIEFEPGTNWEYSSGETNLLGKVLEHTFATQCDYKKWVYKTFGELGLGSVLIEPDASGSLVFSSFGWATARDWARFGQLQLSSEWAKRTTNLVDVSITSGERKPYAGHFWKRFDQPQSNRFYAEGFEFQYTAVIPDLELVVVHLACVRGDAYINFKNHLQHKFLDAVEEIVKNL